MVVHPAMDLPREIVADILSRIPVKTIVHCRCVCKRWRNILSEPYFVNLHLSRSPAGLIIHQGVAQLKIDILKLGELDDKPDQHDIHHDPLMRFDLGLCSKDSRMWLSGSVNGLICLRNYSDDTTCICNPITREYILLPNQTYIEKSYAMLIHGFGFVESSNQYKVVLFYKGNFPASKGSDEYGCEVYTLGTGMWRNLGHVPFSVKGCGIGVYVGGNLHWLADEVICTFDLDKESFQLTAAPAVPQVSGHETYRDLGILGGCLCICDCTPDSELAIWVMKDYGVKESWSKEIVICTDLLYDGMLDEEVYPLKVLKDGTILMFCEEYQLCTYQPGTKTSQHNIFEDGFLDTFNAMVYVPSFISLKSFMLENVLMNIRF